MTDALPPFLPLSPCHEMPEAKSSRARQSRLKALVQTRQIVRVLEVHNALSGLIAESAAVTLDGGVREFDAMWESSLTDSLSKGKPDMSVVDMTSRIQTIDQILDVTTRPIIVDVDNGGLIDYFAYTVRTLDRIGVSAVIVEDKKGDKRNSLTEAGGVQAQDSIVDFCRKIATGAEARRSQDFLVIARIESLVVRKGLEDALLRAGEYIDAGADGIMIHSASSAPQEIQEFCKLYHRRGHSKPLTVVQTTYSSIGESELTDLGVKVVIYANHLLRSAIPAMMKTARSILQHGRSLEAEAMCLPVAETVSLGSRRW
jgi:phosphoenolpyruvate mutase